MAVNMSTALQLEQSQIFVDFHHDLAVELERAGQKNYQGVLRRHGWPVEKGWTLFTSFPPEELAGIKPQAEGALKRNLEVAEAILNYNVIPFMGEINESLEKLPVIKFVSAVLAEQVWEPFSRDQVTYFGECAWVLVQRLFPDIPVEGIREDFRIIYTGLSLRKWVACEIIQRARKLRLLNYLYKQYPRPQEPVAGSTVVRYFAGKMSRCMVIGRNNIGSYNLRYEDTPINVLLFPSSIRWTAVPPDYQMPDWVNEPNRYER